MIYFAIKVISVVLDCQCLLQSKEIYKSKNCTTLDRFQILPCTDSIVGKGSGPRCKNHKSIVSLIYTGPDPLKNFKLQASIYLVVFDHLSE